MACPVVRRDGEVLVFRHPLAGCQVVKGGFEPLEDAAQAALREIYEKAGIAASAPRPGPVRDDIYQGERWHFVEVVTRPLPDRWCHTAPDDDGQRFDFFWLSRGDDLALFASRYRRALDVIWRTA